MKKAYLAIAAMLFFMPYAVHAQVPARDADIDSRLNAAAMAGIAPPTGSQAAPAAAKGFVDPYISAAMSAKPVIAPLKNEAEVYALKGKAFLIKKGSPVEKRIKKGDHVRPGDSVRTEKNASVSMVFDSKYENAIHIPEDSKVLIESIFPTSIKIENGSVFSAVDGLPQGSSWKVSTPSTVAAVRGTLYVVTFIAANGKSYAATVDVPDDGKDSKIQISSLNGGEDVSILEGQQITLEEGQTPDENLVQDLDPAALQEIMDFFENLSNEREESEQEGQAPATGGDFADTGSSSEQDGGEDNVDLEVTDSNVIEEPSEPAEDVQPEPEVVEQPVENPEEHYCPWENNYENPNSEYCETQNA